MEEGKMERKEREISRAEEGAKPSLSYIHSEKATIPKKHPLRSEDSRFSHLFEQIVVVDAYSSLRERRYSCLRCSIVTQFQEAHFLAATFLEIHHRSTAL